MVPQDIELAAQEASQGVRPGCVAAFPLDDTGASGGVGVVFEIRSSSIGAVEEAVEEVYVGVFQATGLKPVRVVAIKERTIPKTTSGKIRRKESRKQLLGGTLEKVFERGASDEPWLLTFEDAQADSKVSTSQNGSKGLMHCPDQARGEGGVQSDIEALQDSKDTETDEIIKTVLTSFFGPSLKWDESWDDLGLSSMSSLELHQSLCSRLSRSLPDDILQKCKTQNDLRQHILDAPNERIDVVLPDLPLTEDLSFSWELMAVFQILGAGFVLLLFATAGVPAYALYKRSTQVVAPVSMLVAPLILPVWMVSYSFLLLLLKWALIGKYRARRVSLPSKTYICWWLVDRAVHYWELLVGFLIHDTPLLRLYYVMLGAKIHQSAQIRGFIREFDLVKIGRNAILEQNIRCRLFSTTSSQGRGTFTVRFRPTCIERGVIIRGCLCPGAKVGEKSFVQKHSVVPEGGQVPHGSSVEGNPSTIVGPANNSDLQTFGLLKCLWLAGEIYAHLGFFLAAQRVVQIISPLLTSRYSQLAKALLLVLLVQVFSLAASIVIKWLLIGKRHPGAMETSLMRPFNNWAADYHFRLSTVILFSISSNSRVWNAILMLYGMDIDFWSKVGAVSFPPSQVDLVSIKQSFVSKVSFEVEDNGEYHQTVIEESSLGYDAVIGSGVRVARSVVAPNRYVTTDAIANTDGVNIASKGQVFFASLQTDMLYVLFFMLLFASMLPACELVTAVGRSAGWSPKYFAPLFLILCLVQLASFLLLLKLIQLLTYGFSLKSKPWSVPMYGVYITANWALQTWSFLPLLWGTPWFNGILCLLGARFRGKGGRVLFLDRKSVV